jgi:hypothetical protein
MRERSSAISLAAITLLEIPLPSVSHVGLRREEDAPDEATKSW